MIVNKRVGSTDIVLLGATLLAFIFVGVVAMWITPNSLRGYHGGLGSIAKKSSDAPKPPVFEDVEESTNDEDSKEEIYSAVFRDDTSDEQQDVWETFPPNEIAAGNDDAAEDQGEFKTPSENDTVQFANIKKQPSFAELARRSTSLETGDPRDIIRHILATTTQPLSKKGKRHSPRTWTSYTNDKTVAASICGADHVARIVSLKLKGKRPNTYSWDKFSEGDIEYLESYCFDAIQQIKADEYKQHLISRSNYKKRQANTRSAAIKTAMQAAGSMRINAEFLHAFKYKHDASYRRNFENNANRRASIGRAYAYGAGYRCGYGKTWHPGCQLSDGRYRPGCWK